MSADRCHHICTGSNRDSQNYDMEGCFGVHSSQTLMNAVAVLYPPYWNGTRKGRDTQWLLSNKAGRAMFAVPANSKVPDSADCDEDIVEADHISPPSRDGISLLPSQLPICLAVNAAILANEHRVKADPGVVQALCYSREIPAAFASGASTFSWAIKRLNEPNHPCRLCSAGQLVAIVASLV